MRSISEAPDEGGDPLGSTAAVRSLLSRVLPSIDFSDPTWGILDADEYSIEFSIGAEEPCTSLMLHVRGPEEAIVPIKAVCNETGWKAYDCSDGELIDFNADPARGLRAWIEFRNRSTPIGPLKGISLSTSDGKKVLFDSFQRRNDPDGQEIQRKPWWKFWA
jgi:hypothetical protein